MLKVVAIGLVNLLIASIGFAADQPTSTGYDTPQEVFAAYQRATPARDWKTLFWLGTASRQDAELLGIAVAAATSQDDELRKLVESRGLNWRQFDRPWTPAENERFIRDAQVIAAEVAKPVGDKAELFVAARQYLEKKQDNSATQVHELKNLRQNEAAASGDSIESRVATMQQSDAQGRVTRQTTQPVKLTSHLWFRRINGKWYLASENEMSAKK
jgi:hypothetical protein